MTTEWSLLNAFWLGSYLLLWSLVLFLGFVLLGTLRSLGLLRWRLEQLQVTTPNRLGRDGLRPGRKAPGFRLPSSTGKEIALEEFAGRKVLLVFTQSGCGPCKDIVPELNRLQRRGIHQVLVVNNGDPEKTWAWARDMAAEFPVLAQENHSLSKRYQMFGTPFAFQIDERGIITSKGLIGTRQYLDYVLSGASKAAEREPDEPESETKEANGETSDPLPHATKEVEHV